MGYEEDFHRYLQSLVSDCERRIKRGHQRLALSNQQGSVSICLLFNQQGSVSICLLFNQQGSVSICLLFNQL